MWGLMGTETQKPGPGEGGERPAGWRHGGETLIASRCNVHTDGSRERVPNTQATGPRQEGVPAGGPSTLCAGNPWGRPACHGSGLQAVPSGPLPSRLAVLGPAGAPTPSAGSAGCRGPKPGSVSHTVTHELSALPPGGRGEGQGGVQTPDSREGGTWAPGHARPHLWPRAPCQRCPRPSGPR